MLQALLIQIRRQAGGQRPGHGRPGRAAGRCLCPLSLALLLALPLSPLAVERENTTISKNSGPIINLKDNETVIVLPGVTIDGFARNTAGLNINNAISGNASNAGLDNRGTLKGTVGFLIGGSISEVKNSGTIDAGSFGINTTGSITTLTNSGKIETERAILAGGRIGNLSNEKDGNITGFIFGVKAASIGTLTNEGKLIGNAEAAISTGGKIDKLSNEKDAKITSRSGNGIVFGSIGTLSNAGEIRGRTNAGTPEAGKGFGLIGGGAIDTLTNEATGLIQGPRDGIRAGSIGTELSNKKGGRIEGGAGHAGIRLTSGTIASEKLTNSGTIKGDTHGLLAASSIAELDNSGQIEGQTGVFANAIGLLKNKAGGEIQGAAAGASTSNRGVTVTETLGRLENSGDISGGDGGVKAKVITTLNNKKGGTISGSRNFGVHAEDRIGTLAFGRLESGKISNGDNGVLENSGEISGGDSGVKAKIINTLINKKDGTISGSRNFGVHAEDRIGGSELGGLENNGEISGGNGGVKARTINTLINKKDGTISGNLGVHAEDRIGRLENDGEISGSGPDGVRADGAIDELKNKGVIKGVQSGVRAASIGDLNNSGRIESEGSGTNSEGLNVSGHIRTLSNTGRGEIAGRKRGIQAGSIGRLDNSATIRGTGNEGIKLSGTAPGPVTLKNTGTIEGGAAGVDYGQNTIRLAENSGRIAGGTGAGLTAGPITRLDNKAGGTIESTASNGLMAASIGRLDNAGRIEGGDNGIKLNGTAPGPVMLENTGTIKGGAAGADYGQNAIRLAENSGRITGGTGAGLTAGPITRLDNKAGGTIESTAGNGLMAASIGRLDNAGRIAGGDNGILARGAVNTLNNSGTIRGGRGAALKAGPNNGRRAAIPRGAAASEGIRLSSTAPDPVTLENTGTIEGGTIGADYGQNAILLAENSGRIAGGADAGLAAGPITRLDNKAGGTIESTAGNGLMAASIGRLDNAGRIAGGDNGILARGAVNTLNNSGTIRGGRGAALKAGLITRLQNNGRRAAITSGAVGIEAANILNLDNSGTIRGEANEGIKLSGMASGPATLKNTGTIEGGMAAADYGPNAIRLAENSGRIAGGTGAGLAAGPIARLDNSGTIESTAGNGVMAASIGNLDNTGRIAGGDNGILARGAINTLTNSGTIEGKTGAGLSLGAGGRLENSGRIAGGKTARGIFARGAIELLLNKKGGTIEGKTGILVERARAGDTTIDHAGILRSLDGTAGDALMLRGQGRDRLILRDNFTLIGNIHWDGADDTLQYIPARAAQFTLTDNDAPAGTEPTRFAIEAGPRPVLRGTRRSNQFGKAETTVAILDPTIHTLGDAALSQWTGAVSEALTHQGQSHINSPGQGEDGDKRRALWARPFGGLHRFKRDGRFMPPARHRYGGGLAGVSTIGAEAGAGFFLGAARSVVEVSGPARDEDSESIFTGVWAATRRDNLDLNVALMLGRSKFRSTWQQANNRAIDGTERIQTDYSGLFINPEVGLATRFDFNGVTLRPALRLRYLGLFTEAYAYQPEGRAEGAAALRINERALHIGIARASLGLPLSFPANAHGGQLSGELRIGAEGRARLSGDTVRGLLDSQDVKFRAGGGKAVTGFMGAGFDYVVPALKLTFSANIEARYGSKADLGVHAQVGFMWEF